MDIRLATSTDANAIHLIMMDAYSEYRVVPGSSSALGETVDDIRDAIESGNEKALVGSVEGSTVACVRYSLKDGGVYFYRLAVRRGWQGMGFAKLLLFHLESLAKAEAQPKIWCKVRYSVPRNIYLYQSLGYVKSGEELVHKDKGVTLEVWTMSKSLSIGRSSHGVDVGP
ncbi:GNAT family N-acetyltransferase [Alicyclobacillus acidiphilus]|uniref:GNAT family N-acetyltransferase n=1 Tax=Alicyclobacillus acidiphilus TaxID=182455 RepID=UPI00082A782E|nr:GNAT family N-acetyltransferase [Alicyclobacillus acidiphilus]